MGDQAHSSVPAGGHEGCPSWDFHSGGIVEADMGGHPIGLCHRRHGFSEGKCLRASPTITMERAAER